MAATGFKLAKDLSEALRNPYYLGDNNVTVSYLVEGLKIGEHRVMLKRNFNTACWIPPAGSRGSHSIYYGDRMLERVIDRFCKKEEVSLDLEVLKTRVTALVAASGGKQRVTPSLLFDEKVKLVQELLTPGQWKGLLDWLVQAVAAYGRHEREHARNTPQDLKKVTRDLRATGIPFHLFNLFEDARIEHISRQDMGGMFDWMVFEDLAPVKDPIALFLRCIQLEGAADEDALESEEPWGKDGATTLGHVADSVQGYYTRAIQCAHAEHLYPIIVEFMTEFQQELKDREEEESKKGSGAGSGSGSSGPGEDEEDSESESRAGDLSTAAEAAEEGDKFFEEFEGDCEVVGGTDAEGKEAEAKARGKGKGSGDDEAPKGKCTPGGQGIPESIAPQASGGRANTDAFLAQHAGSIDDAFQKRVDALTTTLMQMFKRHSLPAATETPGRRMSGRHLARGELRFLHPRVFGGKGKRRYSIVYDCSGSMHGKPDREGKLLLLALNNLAKRGYLEGTLVLSGWVGGRPGWLSYPFPVAEDIILRIYPSHSSEGLQAALEDNLKSLMGMDDVFVMTDACICDEPINREVFASRKIWPVGLYVGSKENATEMERHFPQNIIRDSIEQVVDAMLTRNRRTVG